MRRQRWMGIAGMAVIAVVVATGVRWATVDDAAVPDVLALQGDWVEPIPGMEGEVQGFSLRANGVAESIDMATLQYRHWRLDGGALVLAGESIGNRTSSAFEESFRIARADGARLELVDDRGVSRTFTRR